MLSYAKQCYYYHLIKNREKLSLTNIFQFLFERSCTREREREIKKNYVFHRFQQNIKHGYNIYHYYFYSYNVYYLGKPHYDAFTLYYYREKLYSYENYKFLMWV